MNLQVDYEKVKMKYYLGIKLDDKLDLEYALYELIHVFIEKDWKEEKTLKKLLWAGYTYTAENYSYQEIFDMMENKGWLSSSEKLGHIYYDIVDHPWKF